MIAMLMTPLTCGRENKLEDPGSFANVLIISSRIFPAWAAQWGRLPVSGPTDLKPNSLRSDLIFLLSVLTFSPSKLIDFCIFFDSEFARKEDFVLNYSDSEADQISRCIYRFSAISDEMLEDMTKLMALNEWDEEATQNMVSHMKGLTAIDARESSSEALHMYFDFRPRWTRFLQDHPDIAEMIDPVYVVACITPGVPLPVWPGVPAAAPLGHLTPLYGGNTQNLSIRSSSCS